MMTNIQDCWSAGAPRGQPQLTSARQLPGSIPIPSSAMEILASDERRHAEDIARSPAGVLVVGANVDADADEGRSAKPQR